MSKTLTYPIILLTIFLTACSGATEPAPPTPAASAPTATPIPPDPTATLPPAEPTAANSPDPTPMPEPTATDTPAIPTVTAITEPTAEPTAELIGEHDAAEVVVDEPEFAGEALQGTWQELAPANEGPSPRYEHAMQYSPATNQVFVFGGRDGNQVFNDV